MFKERIAKFQQFIKSENLDGFILNQRAELKHVADIRYLCGFTGDTGLMIVNRDKAFLIIDSRFHTQAARETKGVIRINSSVRPVQELKGQKQFQKKNMKFGFDPDCFTYREISLLKASLPSAILVESPGAIALASIVKDKNEIIYIQKAIDIAETAFERILAYLKPGLTEMEIAAELEYQMKMLGAEQPAFDTIVASGYRGALPHGVASTKKIKSGEFVTFDFGAKFNGYVSDITRTVVIGKANSRQKKIYNTVLKANLAGIKKIKAGVKGPDVDRAARQIIEKAGFGKNFGHGLGHGIGIYVHVGPSLGSKSEDILRSGMVVTVEPGIYIPGWGGVRIEDDVLVTTTGSRVLTKAPKKLLEV